VQGAALAVYFLTESEADHGAPTPEPGILPTMRGNERRSAAAKRLVVVSIDGLSLEEWEGVRSLPNFAALIERGSSSRSLKSVFPSLTYVVHTTMMTGRHPAAHGVTHNHPLQPGVPTSSQRWFWYASEVKTPTLFDLARAAGMSTAAVLWPLVGGARITWNFPEIAALPGESQTLKVLRAGSAAYLLELQLRFGRYRRGAEQPYLDDFVSRCAAYTIERKRPRLLMTHLIALDAAKHESGSASPLARSALEFLDGALGRIVGAVAEAGIADETAIVVLGDHGHIDIRRRVRLNLLLEAAGLCGQKDGRFEWRTWCRCSGGSAFLHVRSGDDEAARLALAALDRAAAEGGTGIEAILGPSELAALHCDTDARAALKAERGTQFVEDMDGDLLEAAPAGATLGADHGYAPDTPEYRSLFIAAGPGVRRGVEFGEAEMVDIGPTLARLLGLEFAVADGRVLEEILEEPAPSRGGAEKA